MPTWDQLISRGIVPRPPFATCSGCEMPSTCSSVRHCAGAAVLPDAVLPIDMVLHCPECHTQHIDAQGEHREIRGGDLCVDRWDNPPHRSHLCRPEDGGCGAIWRPSDVPTNGVRAVKTRGRADTWPKAPCKGDQQ